MRRRSTDGIRFGSSAEVALGSGKRLHEARPGFHHAPGQRQATWARFGSRGVRPFPWVGSRAPSFGIRRDNLQLISKTLSRRSSVSPHVARSRLEALTLFALVRHRACVAPGEHGSIAIQPRPNVGRSDPRSPVQATVAARPSSLAPCHREKTASRNAPFLPAIEIPPMRAPRANVRAPQSNPKRVRREEAPGVAPQLPPASRAKIRERIDAVDLGNAFFRAPLG